MKARANGATGLVKYAGNALAAGICFLFFGLHARAQGNINLNDLTQETQKLSQNPGEMTLLWWIPEEFWRASMSQDPDVTKAKMEEFLKVIRPYTLLAVVDGTMGAFGGVTYKSEETIRGSVKIKDSQGRIYLPLAESAVSPDAKNMLQTIKPVIVNILGPMGQNMHFLLFPGNAKDGAPVIDPKKKGTFSVVLGEKDYRWRLPLDSLFPSTTCPKCGEVCKGSWAFCPWCGTKLTAASAPQPKPIEKKSGS